MDNNEQYKITLGDTPNGTPQEAPVAPFEPSFNSFDNGFSMGDTTTNNGFNTAPAEPQMPNNTFSTNSGFNMGDTSGADMNTNEPINNAFTTDDISNGIKNGANSVLNSLGFQKGGDNKKAFTDLLKSLFVPVDKESMFIAIGMWGIAIAFIAGLMYAILPYIVVISNLLLIIRNFAFIAASIGGIGMLVKKQWIPFGIAFVTNLVGNGILVLILDEIFTSIYY